MKNTDFVSRVRKLEREEVLFTVVFSMVFTDSFSRRHLTSKGRIVMTYDELFNAITSITKGVLTLHDKPLPEDIREEVRRKEDFYKSLLKVRGVTLEETNNEEAEYGDDNQH